MPATQSGHGVGLGDETMDVDSNEGTQGVTQKTITDETTNKEDQELIEVSPTPSTVSTSSVRGKRGRGGRSGLTTRTGKPALTLNPGIRSSLLALNRKV